MMSSLRRLLGTTRRNRPGLGKESLLTCREAVFKGASLEASGGLPCADREGIEGPCWTWTGQEAIGGVRPARRNRSPFGGMPIVPCGCNERHRSSVYSERIC